MWELTAFMTRTVPENCTRSDRLPETKQHYLFTATFQFPYKQIKFIFCEADVFRLVSIRSGESGANNTH
jgi:hypothetical protein